MAPKRLDKLPPAPAALSEEESSSSESLASEEEAEEMEEEEDTEQGSDDELESDHEKPQPPIQAQPKEQPTSQTKQDSSSSGSESESESGSDSESEHETSPRPDPETQKSKKAKTQPPTPSKPPSSKKRPNESEDSKKPDSKKKKKTSHEGHETKDVDGPPPSEKYRLMQKPLFQRVWSDEDEIALLKGMIDFVESKGVDPSSRMGEFYEFVKQYIKMDASQSQLSSKIRGLKSKFKNNEGKGKNGQDKVPNKPHDQKVWEMMKRLWGVDSGIVPDDGTKMNGTPKSNKKLKSVVHKEENMEKGKDVLVEKSTTALPEKDEPVLKDSICVIETSKLFPDCVNEAFLKGLGLIGEKKRAKLEKRWMELRVAEMKVDSERALLFHEQNSLIIEALSRKE